MEQKPTRKWSRSCQNVVKGTLEVLYESILLQKLGGGKFGIVGFSLRNDHTGTKPLYWNFPEMSEIAKEFELISKADFKVAYVHWGVEYIDHPSWQQQKMGHWLIDLGFDLVVGMHPHVLQGYEVYKGKHIFYSLGNFVFNMAHRPTHYGAVVGIEEDNHKVMVEYVEIGEDFCPRIVSERDIPQAYQFHTLNKKIPCYDNTETFIAEAQAGLKAYRKSNRKNFLKHIHKYNRNVLWGMVIDFIKRKIHKDKQYDTSNTHDWGG